MNLRPPYGLAAYLGVIQFLFALCWTVYVVYLPRLLEAAGLPKTWVLWVLLLDQVVFATTDLAMGLYADRVRATLRRLGPMIVAVTIVSCAAFALLPFGAGAGMLSPVVLLALIGIWTVTSSALRGPPWLLLSQHTMQPAMPWLAAINLCGLAFAAALSPYLALTLRAHDPRLPFVLSSLVLALTVGGLIVAERRMSRAAATPQSDDSTPEQATGPASTPTLGVMFAGAILLGVGFQAHIFFNAGPLYLRFATTAELDRLLPIFWIGFSFAMFPGAGLAARFGLWRVLIGACVVAVSGSLFAATAGSLQAAIAGQLVAGGGWGCILMALCSAALRLGYSSKQGFALGMVWSALSVAALVRFGLGIAEVPKAPGFAQFAVWAPPIFWAFGGMVLFVLFRRVARV